MRDARLRLNPEKCVFGVRQGKILGYLVSHRGIEANPTKIQAIVDMSPPQSARDVQRLTGRLAALNRFISRSAERSLPFLKTLRGAKDFAWGPEQAAAFASLKQYLSELAILTSPDSSLPLLLYVADSPHAVSVALVQEQTVEGAGSGNISEAAQAEHFKRCYPEPQQIAARVKELLETDAAKGLENVYIMTNGKQDFIDDVKKALGEVKEWNSITSSRDIVVNREQEYVKQAIDMLIGLRSQMIIGNGVSSSLFSLLFFFYSSFLFGPV